MIPKQQTETQIKTESIQKVSEQKQEIENVSTVRQQIGHRNIYVRRKTATATNAKRKDILQLHASPEYNT